MNDPSQQHQAAAVADAEKRIGVSIEIELKTLTVPQQRELVRRLSKLLPLYDPGSEGPIKAPKR